MTGANSKVNLKLTIPPLPGVAIRILKFDIENPEHDISEMEEILKPDRGLCTEILKIANSAYYGRSGTIKTLRDAITLLGLKTVKNIVFMLQMQKLNLILSGATYKKYIHEYGILTALIAYDLCAPFNRKALREEIFLSGLLYKIGMTILGLENPGKYLQVLNRAERDNLDILQIEREEFNTDHIEVGAAAFKSWDMPPELIEVVEKFNITKEEVELQSDRVLLTLLAALISAKLLGIFSIPEKDEIIKNITNHYGVSEMKIAIFDDEYLKLMQNHPLYRMAAP